MGGGARTAVQRHVPLHYGAGKPANQAGGFPGTGRHGATAWREPRRRVKVGIRHLMQDRPDVVFSGINCGYNVGVDILYSGTVGAAMEALLNGIPAIAFPKNRAGRARWRMPIFCLSPKSCWRQGVRRMKYGM